MSRVSIAFIGAGSNGAVGMANLLRLAHDFSMDIEVTCIHDPNTSIFEIGEVVGPKTLNDTLKFLKKEKSSVKTEIDGIVRYGVKHHWKKANKDFDILYDGHEGAHVNSEKFSKFVIENMEKDVPNFNVIHDYIDEIINHEDAVVLVGKKHTYQFDYVVDCSGWPSLEQIYSDDYAFPPFEFVNQALLYQDYREYNEDMTSMYVHENGWMFGIPISFRKTFGYIYNTNYTRYPDALKNFETSIGEYLSLIHI